MRNCLGVILLVLFLSVPACKTGTVRTTAVTGYNLSVPDQSVVLPDILHEISGLAYIDSNVFACVQDEFGIVFLYDLEKKKVISQVEFFKNGDFEGIARNRDTIFVLRSDGNIFEIAGYTSEKPAVTQFETRVPSKDNEGLCFDPLNNRLLIACKEKTGKGDLSKDNRYIFGFDLMSKKLTDDPVFTFDVDSLKKYATDNKVELPLRTAKKGLAVEPVLKLRSSAIAIHPVTGDIYIISAEDYLLIVFDRGGRVKRMVKLHQGLFNQAEGVAFFNNGDMVISNEGFPKGGPATLRMFKYKPE